jgi:hypothetical protein
VNKTLKRILFVIFLLCVGFSTSLEAQSGGKRRESGGAKAKKRFNTGGTRSAGHADKFARSTGRKGIFARLFKKQRPSWVNRQTGDPKKNWKENRFLYTRHRTPGNITNSRNLEKQNTRREQKRDRGNASFTRKKHGR